MDFNFVPTNHDSAQLKVPYLEDARADFAPYYDIRGKTLDKAQSEVIGELAKLGGGLAMFQEGFFNDGPRKRYGYKLTFRYGNGRGLIRVAGLPIRDQETEHKIFRVRLQALLNVRDWLKTAVTSRVFSPGSDVLIPHMLINPNDERTVADYIAEMGQLPRLNPPPDHQPAQVLEGEVIE